MSKLLQILKRIWINFLSLDTLLFMQQKRRELLSSALFALQVVNILYHWILAMPSTSGRGLWSVRRLGLWKGDQLPKVPPLARARAWLCPPWLLNVHAEAFAASVTRFRTTGRQLLLPLVSWVWFFFHTNSRTYHTAQCFPILLYLWVVKTGVVVF